MAENSKIGWTDHTFNPWWGCEKVHAGCALCYAESVDKRWGGDHWGKPGVAERRMILGEWGKPERWNLEAKQRGTPARVFVSSMCDIMEDFPPSFPVIDQQGKMVAVPENLVGGTGGEVGYYIDDERGGKAYWNVPSLRRRALRILERLTHLRVLLLTKRPQHVARFVPIDWLSNWPSHIWVGSSPCNAATLKESVEPLLKLPTSNLFLSVEPMLGPVGLADYLDRYPGRIRWVIIGGESEQHGKCREFSTDAAIDLLEQCVHRRVAVFVKQMGSKPIQRACRLCRGSGLRVAGWRQLQCDVCYGKPPRAADLVDWPLPMKQGKGEDISEWPERLRRQEFPQELVF